MCGIIFVPLHTKCLSMDWLQTLFTSTDSVAHIVLLYALVISVGIGLGRLKIGGISLGVTFVLFAGILAGHIGFTGTLNVLDKG